MKDELAFGRMHLHTNRYHSLLWVLSKLHHGKRLNSETNILLYIFRVNTTCKISYNFRKINSVEKKDEIKHSKETIYTEQATKPQNPMMILKTEEHSHRGNDPRMYTRIQSNTLFTSVQANGGVFSAKYS